MKLDITQLKELPGHIKQNNFSLCVYGTPNEEISAWINAHNLKTEPSEKFTNIIIPDTISLSELFQSKTPFDYMDGFSPNLNKHLHIGHFSNLVYAKAFQSINIAYNTISVLGDTLTGDVSNDEAYNSFQFYINQFNYKVGKIFLASVVKVNESIMIEGEGEYAGTKIFDLGDKKVVGIKANGSTTYFYQDVAVAQNLNKPTVYITGSEQKEHFSNLKKMFPNTDHIPLGLVLVKEKDSNENKKGKMSTRNGNVIYLSDLISKIKELLETDNDNLVYNIFAGFILKTTPESNKSIDIELISNPKNSPGLYISYTMARIYNTGLEYKFVSKFNDKKMEFAFLKSKFTLMPNIMFDALLEKCKEINQLYLNHVIKGNPENQKIFLPLWNDLLYGSQLLGLIFVEKV